MYFVVYPFALPVRVVRWTVAMTAVIWFVIFFVCTLDTAYAIGARLRGMTQLQEVLSQHILCLTFVVVPFCYGLQPCPFLLMSTRINL